MANTKPIDVRHLYAAKIINAMTMRFWIVLAIKVGGTRLGPLQLGHMVSSGCTGLLQVLQLAILIKPYPFIRQKPF
jgi:hypothetical protein